MRRMTLTVFVGVVALAAYATGCLDRKPAPICPVPIEVAKNRVSAGEFDGVDMLVVVDNSRSMAEEQQILSTGFFTLINSLTRPIASTWAFSAVENMRVAVVSSDMGLQYGETRATDLSPTGAASVSSCENLVGDDGAFLPIPNDVTIINVESGVISCEETGGQCPDGFNCEEGICNSSTAGVDTVNCVPITNPNGFAETTKTIPEQYLTTQVACMAKQGTDGCGVEQQLEAAVRGIEMHQDAFLVSTHLLAVLIVSDEEDCSIKDPALFSTPEWQSGSTGRLNISCNISELNESYLFSPERYHSELIKFKNNAAAAVIFAAIVGVPQDDICQGEGGAISGCLDHPDMQLVEGEFKNENGTPYIHFEPACTRLDEETNDEVTSARPGRRYVKVAQLFESNSYVYSICNRDWSKAMERIAEIIARQMAATCYTKQLAWTKIGKAKRDELECPDCGEAKCDVVVEITRGLDHPDKDKCPDNIYEGLTNNEKSAYLARKEVQEVKDATGTVTGRKIFCPLPKIPAPKECSEAEEFVRGKFDKSVGWYYCETSGENFVDACEDEADNDQDGAVDCDDDECKDCVRCGGEGLVCKADKCRYGIELTQSGKDVTTGYTVNVQCLQQFRFEDQNCQEDSKKACNNGLDDDGNGAYDCVDTMDDPNASQPHQADSNCCPMDDPVNNLCKPRISEIKANCGGTVWYEIDACQARIRELGCTVPKS